MKDISTLPLWTDISPRSYAKPTVVRFRTPTEVRYAVCGTDYGYLHTTGGDVRTWKSYSGARKVAKAYRPF